MNALDLRMLSARNATVHVWITVKGGADLIDADATVIGWIPDSRELVAVTEDDQAIRVQVPVDAPVGGTR